MQLVETATQRRVEPVMVDKATGEEIIPGKYAMVPGPAASPLMKYRHEYLLRKREGDSGQKFQPEPTEMPAMNPTSKKNILVLAALGAAALAAASYGAYWWHTGRFMQTTDDAYVGGDISAISSKVSGYIQQLAVQDNMAVKKGDLLIRIDDRDYRAALAKAAGEVAAQQAALADIQATRQLQQATIAGSAASLLAATAATEKLANDNRRYNALAASSAISHRSGDNASADYRRAHAEQEKAKADKTVAERQLAVLDARHQQILAAWRRPRLTIEMARLNLSYTDIRAPFDGVISNRRAWSGSFVSSGTQLLSLVPAHGLWIDANFKENQLAHCVPASR